MIVLVKLYQDEEQGKRDTADLLFNAKENSTRGALMINLLLYAMYNCHQFMITTVDPAVHAEAVMNGWTVAPQTA